METEIRGKFTKWTDHEALDCGRSQFLLIKIISLLYAFSFLIKVGEDKIYVNLLYL